MNNPSRSSDVPFEINVKNGETYFWCTCGKSKEQPFCDGAHIGTSFKPIKYEAKKSKKVLFCGCKLTKTPPICDGSHNLK